MTIRGLRRCHKCRASFKLYLFGKKKRDAQICKECRKKLYTHSTKNMHEHSEVKQPNPFNLIVQKLKSIDMIKKHNTPEKWVRKLTMLSDLIIVGSLPGTAMLHGLSPRSMPQLHVWKKKIGFVVPDLRNKENRNKRLF